MTYESALMDGGNVILFYEANGKNVRDSVWQPVVSIERTVSSIEYPHIEYRITDVTRLDSNNTFWAINYLWPGDKERLNPATDFISKKFGKGTSHKKSEAVE
jgi:hypothetical protein